MPKRQKWQLETLPEDALQRICAGLDALFERERATPKAAAHIIGTAYVVALQHLQEHDRKVEIGMQLASLRDRYPEEYRAIMNIMSQVPRRLDA